MRACSIRVATDSADHERTGEPVADILIEYTAIGADVDLTPVRTTGIREALPLAG